MNELADLLGDPTGLPHPFRLHVVPSRADRPQGIYRPVQRVVGHVGCRHGVPGRPRHLEHRERDPPLEQRQLVVLDVVLRCRLQDQLGAFGVVGRDEGEPAEPPGGVDVARRALDEDES